MELKDHRPKKTNKNRPTPQPRPKPKTQKKKTKTPTTHPTTHKPQNKQPTKTKHRHWLRPKCGTPEIFSGGLVILSEKKSSMITH